MEENNITELEEGEACCYIEEDANNIDPDTAFSYIDERIQKCLGHFQKDFEGEASAENLGAKFGGYGSFLPTYERPAFPRQISPVRSSVTFKSLNSVPAEGTLQNVQDPATVPPSSKLQNENHSMESLHSAKLHSGDVNNIKQESSLCTSSVVVCQVESGANKSENKTNPRSLKIRIRVVPDVKTKKNVALYDGLGLVGSPSTSFGSSSEESEGQPSLAGVASNLSSADILQVMNSLPVPAGELISPLHDSLLSLVKKEPVPKESRPAQNMKVSVASARPANQLANKPGTVKMSKQKKLKSGQHKRLTEAQYVNDTNVHSKMPSSPGTKKRKHELLESEGSQQAVASTSEVSMGVCRVKGRSRAVSNVVKESNPGWDGGTRIQNGRKSSTVRAGEITFLSTNIDPPFNFNDRLKVEKSSVLSQDSKQLFKCEGVLSITEEDPPLRKVGQFRGHNGAEEKRITGGRKLKGIVFDGKEAVCPTKVRLTGIQELGAKDMKRSSLDVCPSRNNVRVKSEKHLTRHTYDHKDANPSSRELKCPDLPSRGRRKSLSSNNGDTGNAAALSCSKERNIFLSGTALEDVPKMIIPESTLAVAAVETDKWFWVACDDCKKWRKLPLGRTDADIPEKWLCSMLDWLPEKITCDISQDATTAATEALSASQFESHTNGFISGVTSSDIQYFSQNPHSFSNHAPDNKLSSKDVLGYGKGNFLSLNKGNRKTSQQESSKRRNLSNMIPPPTESHSWKKAESADPSKASVLISKGKERTWTKGDDKLLKVKGKRECNEYGADASKIVKIVGDTSGLIAQRKLKISSKYHAEVHPPKDQKTGGTDRLVVSLKKLGGRALAQAPADYASLDLNESNKGSSSLKKRKLKDFQEILPDGSGEFLSRKVKKFRALDMTRNETSSKDEDDRTNEEVSTLRDLSSGFVNTQTDILDGISTGMDRRRKHQKVLGTQLSFDHVDLMRGDTGNGQILLAATSSSSKVSSSHKTRANYEVKGSPVESISSSRLRVKLTDASSRLRHHSDTKTGIAPVMGNARKISAEKTNGVKKLSRVASEEKLSTDFCQDSLKRDKAHRNAEPLAESGNCPFIGTAGFLGDGELSADTCVDHSAGESRAHMENRESALLPIQSGDVSKQRSKYRDECPKPDFCILGEKTMETAMEEMFESEVRTEHAPSHTYTLTFTNVADENDKKRGGRRESLGHSLNDGRVNKLVKEYHCLQDSSLNKSSHDSEGQTRAASVSGDSKSILGLTPQDGSKEGISKQASARAVSQVSACRVNLADVSDSGNVSNEVKMNKSGASNSLDCFALDRQEYKNVIASSPARVNLSNQTANDVLKKVQYLRDHGDRPKNCGFTSESSGACFEAALKSLLGASLLENCSGENGKQAPLQLYIETAKQFQSCATKFEGHEEMAAAALAYKCMEVAFMRVVYWKHDSLSRYLHELQAALHQIQGESPSSSASDVDNLNNQAVSNMPSLPKGAAPQVVGSSIARVLDFTQDASLAMEASRKCHICFTEAAIAGTEKYKNSDHVNCLKTVIDFSFQDIERLICLVQCAWEAIGHSGLSGAKE